MVSKSWRSIAFMFALLFAISLFCFPFGSVYAQTSLSGRKMGGSVNGRIVDVNRVPVSNVLLWAVDINTRRTSGPVLTNNDGRFSFPILLPGSYDLFIDLTSSILPGHIVATSVKVKSGDVLRLRVRLDKAINATSSGSKANALVVAGKIGIIIGVTGGVRSSNLDRSVKGSSAAPNDLKDDIDSIHDKLRSPAQ